MRIRALQSGTSGDGIDHVTATFERDGDRLRVEIEEFGTEPFPDDVTALLADVLAGAPMTPEEWNRLDVRLGQAFAAVAAGSSSAGALDLVVSHGQTVHHGADARGGVWGTLQLGQAAWIAQATGRPVVFGLRVADVAAGGMGAPLMTAFDRLWLGGRARAEGRPVASLNLGGIANVQIVTGSGEAVGFDTGPAGALLDAWMRHATGDPLDRDGRHAAAGHVDDDLLSALRRHPFFAEAPPKTTGRETFDLGVVTHALQGRDLALDDVCATLVELTAGTVADALRAEGIGVVIASGGGTRNPVLLSRLRALLAPARLELSDERGIPAPAREALMFALLGWFAAARIPLELSGTPTGSAAVAGQWDLSTAPLPVVPRGPAPVAVDVRTGIPEGVTA